MTREEKLKELECKYMPKKDIAKLNKDSAQKNYIDADAEYNLIITQYEILKNQINEYYDAQETINKLSAIEEPKI